MIKKLNIVSSLFLAVAIFYCFSYDQLFAQNDSDNLTHEITYSKKDSRSESRHGFVYITLKNRKIEVPDVFSYIEDQKTGYQFLQRRFPWGDDGYFPVDRVLVKLSDIEIKKDNLLAGYYRSQVKYKGTPDSWFYGVTSEGPCFFSGKSVNLMLEELKPKKIERYIIELPRKKPQ